MIGGGGGGIQQMQQQKMVAGFISSLVHDSSFHDYLEISEEDSWSKT